MLISVVHASSILAFLLIAVQSVFAKNILFFHLLVSASHRTSIWPLAEKLADRGHNVTYIFPMETSQEVHHPKIEELVPSKVLPILDHYVGDFDINIRINGTKNEWLLKIFTISLNLCEAFYESPEIKSWLEKPGLHYDLILLDGIMGECVYGLVHKFKAKHIMFQPIGTAPWMWDHVGMPPETASVPEWMFHKKPQEMDKFINRLLTTLSMHFWRYKQDDFLKRLKPMIQKTLNVSEGELPDMREIEANTSLIFLNSYFIDDYPLALPPMVQSYSGLWCSKDKLLKTKPLPKDITDFVGNDSVVYVSLGSAVASSGMPESLRDEFFEAFRAFPKSKFLWRWTDDKNIPKNTPKNVMLRRWFPQRDVLADSRTKAYIIQGGRPSTQEAICYGIPMIAFPIFADQDYNVNRLEHVGAAIVLDIVNITGAVLQDAISRIVSNDTYKATLRELSGFFRDRPMDPLENALYWTEYVLRHDTSHLMPLGRNRNWYQRRLLDVYLFIGITVLIIVLMFCYLIKLCVHRLISSNKKIKKD